MFGLDTRQLEAIGFDYVINGLTPDSPYGREKIKQIAFLDEAALEACFDNMEKIISQIKKYEEIRPLLASLKNIRVCITKTEVLTQVDIFEIKIFLIALEKFGDIVNPMTEALAIVDPSGLRIATFAVESPLLFSIRKEKLRMEGTDPLLIEQEVAEESRVLLEMTNKLRMYTEVFLANMEIIGELDFIMAKARLALEFQAVRPAISTRGVLSFREMGNPYVAGALKDRVFTKVSLSMNNGVTIITGANMGGKSVALKTAVLNTLLCRVGFFVFAREAEVPLFDGIYLVSEDMQDVRQGLSSFGSEMTRLNEIVARLKTEFLFIALDELARGTNPEEGAAIVRAVANHLAESGSVCIISTHYNRVTSPRFKHYQVAGVKASYMDYNLVEAPHDAPLPKDALKICKLIGLDKNLLAEMEKEANHDTNTNQRP